ncbi:hypothetical protein BGZ61DRAFT_69787 [Ilyonectria robusta]|uniref:uncharacterized protein n=1 Tax=Ilyonectria robusta TaxID=1079257 RepID=UPI001E8D6E64|nr:uncharacterized protein BGZ61DRAFT_69787 [Ilyonectria robusta]KAH8679295.1 hypothetical protein BGZ61DRAFT_69787 [Ilyonectria robusta]
MGCGGSSGWDVESGFPHDSLLFPLGRLAELPSTGSISSRGRVRPRTRWTRGGLLGYWVAADPPARRPLVPCPPPRSPASPPWVNGRVVSLCHCSHTRWLTDLPLPRPCSFRKESFLPALFCEIGTRVMATVSGPDALGLMPRSLHCCFCEICSRTFVPESLLCLSCAWPSFGWTNRRPSPPVTSCLASAFNLLCSTVPPYHESAITTSPSPLPSLWLLFFPLTRLASPRFASSVPNLPRTMPSSPPHPFSLHRQHPSPQNSQHPPRCELVRPGPAAGARGPPPKLIWWLSSHCNCTTGAASVTNPERPALVRLEPIPHLPNRDLCQRRWHLHDPRWCASSRLPPLNKDVF